MSRDHQPELRASPGRSADFFDGRPPTVPSPPEVFRTATEWKAIIVAWFRDFPDMAWVDFLEHHPGAKRHRAVVRALCRSGVLVKTWEVERRCELYRVADQPSVQEVQARVGAPDADVADDGHVIEPEAASDDAAEEEEASELVQEVSSAPDPVRAGWTAARCYALLQIFDDRLRDALAEWKAIEESERLLLSLAARKSELSKELSSLRARRLQLDDLCQLIEQVEADDLVVEA